jgi:hypothetical protein
VVVNGTNIFFHDWLKYKIRNMNGGGKKRTIHILLRKENIRIIIVP